MSGALAFVFFLEEPSAKQLIEGIRSQLFPPDVAVQYVVFEGKQDLEKGVARKLRSWGLPKPRFVILRDQDAGSCAAVKERLVNLVATSGQRDVLIRIACHELESWVLGDFPALADAFERPTLVEQSVKARYRDPDCLSNPILEIRKFIPEYQKVEGARRVANSMQRARNQSRSFHAFCIGIDRLLALA